MKILKDDSLDIEQLLQQKLKYGYAWLVYRDDLAVLKPEDLKFFKTQKEAITFRAANTPNIREILLLEPFARYITEKLKLQTKHLASKNLLPDTIRVDIDMLHLTTYEKEQIREKAEDLNDQLTQWGMPHNFIPIFETAIGKNAPVVFQTSCKFDKDLLKSLLFLESGTNGYYHIHAFTSVLKKQIEIPDLTIAGINAREVDRYMGSVNWDLPGLSGQLMKDDLMNVAEDIAERAIQAQVKLERLSLAPEGKEVAEKLMAKHWLDTRMEGLMDDPDALDKKYIIRQNFDKMGNTIFTQKEAYNIMAERYVSKDIIEGGVIIQPWYYRHSHSGASFSNIIRISASENLNLHKHLDKLLEVGFQISSREDFIKNIRRGDEIKTFTASEHFRQDFNVYFNPFLNEMEPIKIGELQKLDKSQDNDLNLGKGPRI